MYTEGTRRAGRVEVDALVGTRPARALTRRHAPPLSVDDHLRRPRLTMRRTLLCGDVIGLTAALILYTLLWSRAATPGLSAVLLAAAAIAVTILIVQLLGLYDKDRERADHTTADEIFTVFQAVTLSTWIVLAASFVSRSKLGDPRGIVALWAMASILMLCVRVVARTVGRHQRSHVQRTVILGAGEVGQWVAQKLVRNPHLGLDLVGFVGEQPRDRRSLLEDLPVLGGLEDLRGVVHRHAVERVIVAFSDDSDAQMLEAIRGLGSYPAQVDIVPRLFETVGPNADMHLLEGLPLIGLPRATHSPLALALKRTVDIAVSTAALLILLPLMAVIAIGIKLDSRGPVLYLGERVGRNGRRFRLCKFRTMSCDACRGEQYGAERAEELFAEIMRDPARREEFERVRKLRDDPRVTRFGALLRRTSLDELPQLVNVIRGDLSLVGPRPVTAYEFDKFDLGAHGARADSDDVISLHRPAGYWELDSLRPGVTGYWQVMARSNVSYEERLRLDMTYMTSWSLKLDLQIAARTLHVLVGRGAY
jgi:exopolysaccharide biosynthesis polyprenyl glycosylphosphotransferase